MYKQTHLIEEYKVVANTILCCCDWFGDADSFTEHQSSAPPTDKKPSPDPYEAENYFTRERDKKAYKKLVDERPDYFDYVQED